MQCLNTDLKKHTEEGDIIITEAQEKLVIVSNDTFNNSVAFTNYVWACPILKNAEETPFVLCVSSGFVLCDMLQCVHKKSIKQVAKSISCAELEKIRCCMRLILAEK